MTPTIEIVILIASGEGRKKGIMQWNRCSLNSSTPGIKIRLFKIFDILDSDILKSSLVFKLR